MYDEIISMILGLLVIIFGFYLKNREKQKPSLKLNVFLGYNFFKHYGVILIVMGFFLVLISLHSVFYR